MVKEGKYSPLCVSFPSISITTCNCDFFFFFLVSVLLEEILSIVIIDQNRAFNISFVQYNRQGD